jgi:hypothetical protein
MRGMRKLGWMGWAGCEMAFVATETDVDVS